MPQRKKMRRIALSGYCQSIVSIGGPTITSAPSSSAISRRSAAARDSPDSGLPPGNSQSPARWVPARRRVMRIFPSRSITPATTATGSGTRRSEPSLACVRRDAEAEEARGIEAEHAGARGVAELTHGALDRLCRMRPRAFVVRVVVGPHQALGEAVALGQVEAGRVFLERREAVRSEVLARQPGELGPHPEMVLLVGLVHGGEEPRQPADPGLDGGEAQS